MTAAQVAAAAYGFYDIDLKDNDVGNYQLVAYSKNLVLRVNGKTKEETVEKLLKRLGAIAPGNGERT